MLPSTDWVLLSLCGSGDTPWDFLQLWELQAQPDGAGDAAECDACLSSLAIQGETLPPEFSPACFYMSVMHRSEQITHPPSLQQRPASLPPSHSNPRLCSSWLSAAPSHHSLTRFYQHCQISFFFSFPFLFLFFFLPGQSTQGKIKRSVFACRLPCVERAVYRILLQSLGSEQEI